MEPNKKFRGVQPLPTVTGGHIKAFYHTYGTTIVPSLFYWPLVTRHTLKTLPATKLLPLQSVNNYMKCYEQQRSDHGDSVSKRPNTTQGRKQWNQIRSISDWQSII
jgi:hypothetical protein